MQIRPSSNPADDLAERQAQLIIDSAVDYAIVGLDLDGAITTWNVGDNGEVKHVYA